MMLPRKILVCLMAVAVGFKERAYAGLASAAAGVRYTTAGLGPDSPSTINRRGRSSSLLFPWQSVYPWDLDAFPCGIACSPIMRGPACGGWSGCAAVVPGDSIAGEVVVGGLLNFLNIYNILITGRVLLSWVPQLQGVEALQPVYLLTDPYLNVFRRLNLTFGGLDLSVLPAFFLLSFATNAVASLGAEIPSTAKQSRKLEGSARWWETRRTDMMRARREFASSVASTIVGRTSESRRRLFAFRP